MSSGTAVAERSTGTTASQFKANAAAYKYWKTVINGIVRSTRGKNKMADDIDDALEKIASVIDDLRTQSTEGSGYTPPDNFGARGQTAATVADNVLGKSASTSEIRNAFGEYGA